ncbi:MAG: LapA family protein [Acidobacteriota bacterium]|nr:LapA family protein [Acidobacteriota bacterium]
MKAKIILAVVLTALVVVLFFQNREIVTFKIYFWTIGISQVILVPVMVLAGIIIGYLLGTVRREKV